MKNKKGFTIIEVFVVIIIIGVFLVSIIPPFFSGHFGTSKEGNEISMRRYIDTLYPSLQDVTIICSSKDSDGNGYVRCTGAGNKVDEYGNVNDRITIIAECDSNDCAPIQGVDR